MAETFPFGAKTSVFKVAGKMFALSQLAEYPLRVSLKCEPQLAEQLRATYSAVIPGYHLNKFVTGLYQASEVRYDLDEPWLAGAMTIVIVLALMIVAYFIPEDRRLRAMAERDIAASGSDDVAVSPAYERRVRLEGALGAVAGGLVLAAVFLMVTKPACDPHWRSVSAPSAICGLNPGDWI
jgi:uncharacterized membrane protein